MTNRITTVIVGTGLALLVACGGSGGEDTGDAGADTAATITMSDNAFAPSAPEVSQGSVELVNEGEAPHTFTIEGENVDVQVEPGATATASINLEAGTYTMFCRFHRAQGMEGMLTVQA